MGEAIWKTGIAQRGGGIDAGFMASMAALSLAACLAAPWAIVHFDPPAVQRVAQAKPSGPVLAPLPIEVKDGESHLQLAQRLVKKDAFMALALSVEDLPKTAYVDAAGANAGAGYNIEARRRAHGVHMVKKDLASAGFDDKSIDDLLSRDRSRIQAVGVEPCQALRLLSLTKQRYSDMARDAMGAKSFDALPAHKRDVLSYLAYNTGGPHKFVKLLEAARTKNDKQALRQLTPSVKVDGKALKNHRLRAWAQAAWMGPEELSAALSSPVAFEIAYAGKAGQEKFIAAPFVFIGAKLSKERMEKLHREASQIKGGQAAEPTSPGHAAKAKLAKKKKKMH